MFGLNRFDSRSTRADYNPTFSKSIESSFDRDNADIHDIRDNNLNGNHAAREDNPVQRCRFSVPECISNAMKAIGNFFRSIFNLFSSNSVTPNNIQSEQRQSNAYPPQQVVKKFLVCDDLIEKMGGDIRFSKRHKSDFIFKNV